VVYNNDMPKPTRDIERILEVVELIHHQGLSYRQAQSRMKKTASGKLVDLKTMTRYWKYAKEMNLVRVGKLSTRKSKQALDSVG